MPASLLKKDHPAAKQLTVFFRNLNVSKEPRVYMFNDMAYINVSVLIPVLNIKLSNFRKSSKKNIHYISIKRVIYVNRYGLAKLISSSTAPAAFKLWDYIYEVIYKLETQGSVSTQDVVSRKKLIDELTTTQIVSDHNTKLLEQTQDELKELSVDYNEASKQLHITKSALSEIEYEKLALERERDKYKKIATDLARYAKVVTKTKSKRVNSLISELSDISEESDADEYEIERITRDAEKSRRQLKRSSIKQIPKSKRIVEKKGASLTKKYYLMKSTASEKCHGGFTYRWRLVSELPNHDDPLVVNKQEYDSFRDYSKDWNIGDQLGSPFEFIWYMDLHLTKKEYNILDTILQFLYASDEPSMIEIAKSFS